MKRPNCYVVVNCGETPRFGGEFETREDVFEYYSRYESFTGRVFINKRAATKERDFYDAKLEIGASAYVICGVYCKEVAK